MDPNLTDWHNATADEIERPSEDFIRAVAALLETDADDMLHKMGYVAPDDSFASSEAVEV